MGNWNITIRGRGAHHNKNLDYDANRMAATFVKALRDAGQVVTAASITHGSEDDLGAPVRYLDDRDVLEGAPIREPRCAHPVGDKACGLAAGHEGGHEPPVEWR